MEVKEGPTAMLDITREELREDIREITTEVVTKAVKESQRTLITMINEDLTALEGGLRGEMRQMERRLGRKIDSAIATHNRDPRAHRASS